MGRKVPVAERALVARINRVLAKSDEGLRRCRDGSRAFSELGRYYTVNFNRNLIVRKDHDLEELGRELNVLADFETLTAG